MRWSATYIPTLRDNPAEAELVSHQLLVRGGYIRKLAAGVYLYLPLMQRVIDKFSGIVREEMNAAGALEITMSVLCPAEVWQQTKRYWTVGKEQMRLKDRHDHEMVLCGTHEETVTNLVAGELKSYKQLPLNLYQIQVKFRDEIRPRFGLMRGREFMMKDAYTFDATEESFAVSYGKMVDAYFRIFSRAGLDVRKVESDTGAMGGKAAHEFMLLVDTNAGEETILFCAKCDYAANVEKAVFKATPSSGVDATKSIEEVSTPGATTIEQVSTLLAVQPAQLIKTLVYVADKKPVIALVRGDRELNETKLKNALEAIDLEMAGPDEVMRVTGAPVGFAGPIGVKPGVITITDPLVASGHGLVVGANKGDFHIRHVNPGRDFSTGRVVDISKAAAGDNCAQCGGMMESKRGIEVGNTFMLGTKYSESLNARFTDADGTEKPILMGSYGIGITRTPQAALERYSDAKGIIWPKNIAPYLVHLAPLNIDKEAQRAAAERIYADLQTAGIDVLFDDRTERAGVKLNDADLVGMPIRVTIGDKSLADNKVELKARSRSEVTLVHIENVVSAVKALSSELS